MKKFERTGDPALFYQIKVLGGVNAHWESTPEKNPGRGVRLWTMLQEQDRPPGSFGQRPGAYGSLLGKERKEKNRARRKG